MRKKMLPTLGLLWLLVAAAPPAHAGPGDWTGPLYPMVEGSTVDFDDPIAGSKATYANGPDAVEFSVNAKQLEKGHGYTIWLMVFNHPENCLGSDGSEGLRCGQMDHLNPAAMFSVMYGAGDWAHGVALRFVGTRQANSPLAIPSDVFVGPGLVNPEGAEVHFRVRDHGPRQECCAEDQVGTIGGGCTEENTPLGPGERGDYACADVQATGS